MFGQRADHIHVAHLSGHGERVQVGVQIALRPALRVKIHVQHLHAQVHKVLVEERQRLRTVDKLHLQPLERVDVHNALHQPQNHQHDRARGDRHQNVARADRQPDTGRAPERGRRRQAGNLSVAHKDRARAEEAHAGNHRRGDAPKAHAHRRAAQRHRVRHRVTFDQRNQRRADAHQHVRAHARRAIFDFAVDADHRADHHRHADAHQHRRHAQRLAERCPSVKKSPHVELPSHSLPRAKFPINPVGLLYGESDIRARR